MEEGLVFPSLRIVGRGEPCAGCGYGLSLLDPPQGRLCRFCAPVATTPDDVCPQCPFTKVGEDILEVNAHALDCPFMLPLKRWTSGEDVNERLTHAPQGPIGRSRTAGTRARRWRSRGSVERLDTTDFLRSSRCSMS